MSDLYHYFDGNKLKHVQTNVITGIGGFQKYQKWKNIDKLYHVGCSNTATDLMIAIRSEVDRYAANKWYYEHLAKEWGVDDNYLCVYCQQRGIEFHVKRGEFVATHEAVRVSTIEGHGPTLMMAIANLHYELSTALNKSFIP